MRAGVADGHKRRGREISNAGDLLDGLHLPFLSDHGATKSTRKGRVHFLECAQDRMPSQRLSCTWITASNDV